MSKTIEKAMTRYYEIASLPMERFKWLWFGDVQFLLSINPDKLEDLSYEDAERLLYVAENVRDY